jgi:diaminohydroxyphosphoribosylaminopyrimidine deaminase/5-amino-6-(5-phosphoribosylamino)uracil reductase
VASDAEREAMCRAIAISRAALGTSNPNPCVGAVVLDANGANVGDGVTQPIGGDHAEVVALQAAGDAARGSTLVVTLEPCCHTGRTQRCTDVIQAAGVARVVYALTDPHEIAAGGGAQLRAAGVDVEAGLLAAEAATVVGRWRQAMAEHRPHVTWKYAATLDGRSAAADGTSQWITGEHARRDVHRERYEADAVIAGIGTILADDPQLTVRHWPASRQPIRVVVDSDARTPLTARVLDDTAPTIVVVAEDADSARCAALAAAGADVLSVSRRDGRVHLGEMLEALFQRNLAIAYLEGGSILAASLLRDGRVDRVVGYYAPKMVGAGVPVVGDFGVATLTGAAQFVLDDVAVLGADIRVDARRLQRSE